MPPGSTRMTALLPYASDTTPSQRFRIEQWTPYLSAAGIEVEAISFAEQDLTALLPRPGRTLRKAALTLAAMRTHVPRATSTLPRADRRSFTGPRGWPARRSSSARSSAAGTRSSTTSTTRSSACTRAVAIRAVAWLKQPGKTATLCRISDHVVVGNAYLAEWASHHSRRVTVVPTSVDTDRCRPRDPSSHVTDRVVVGWTGSSTSQTYLEAFAPMLRALRGE